MLISYTVLFYKTLVHNFYNYYYLNHMAKIYSDIKKTGQILHTK